MRKALGTEELKRLYGGIAKRYEVQHGLLTFKTDQKGRALLIDNAVREGDKVLDCGAGTGITGILAARKVGPKGQVTLFDLSEDMLAVAREKVAREHLQERVALQSGDMVQLPFADNSFDVVLSSYSLCPLYDPVKGALELYRVTKPGGKIAVAHSTEPKNGVVRYLADRVEDIAWHFPWLSMGCRAVDVLPALKEAGGKVLLQRHIGFPLWPFLVFVIEKPLS
ncbi:class I SAM-dependent methyltransferase [Gallaecimonas kandeliae]|uniref:methyltransferase domain-containing protein n=1 Tax=Gallaecimonas kandeliae TaxID=3029055 RepID=UPI0026477A30|nr:methyltransferase domain-containing protein [Gallaecimonas kandeliae]WKE66976.1 class I SAM-dependent methyltransferase [Gallaecimonas kandeliae]